MHRSPHVCGSHADWRTLARQTNRMLARHRSTAHICVDGCFLKSDRREGGAAAVMCGCREWGCVSPAVRLEYLAGSATEAAAGLSLAIKERHTIAHAAACGQGAARVTHQGQGIGAGAAGPHPQQQHPVQHSTHAACTMAEQACHAGRRDAARVFGQACRGRTQRLPPCACTLRQRPARLACETTVWMSCQAQSHTWGAAAAWGVRELGAVVGAAGPGDALESDFVLWIELQSQEAGAHDGDAAP
jgi:hypothetical protein